MPDWVRKFTHVMAKFPERCNGCQEPLLLENLFVDDGCPCNTPRGVNFKPQRCERCLDWDYQKGTSAPAEDCVKPGHRIPDLFGPFVTGM
jgi:hypothetical protein